MKIHWFYLITTVFCLVILGSIAIILFAQKPVSEVGLIMAWLFWLSLPLAIYRELFFSRYQEKGSPAIYKLRKHRREYSSLAKRHTA